MIVRVAKPPLFDEIDAAFRVDGQRIYYAWGDTIFDPFGDGYVCEEIRTHEAVHGERQLSYEDETTFAGSVFGWWRRYIADPAFRLAEEIPAHRAEYRWYCDRSPNGKMRNARRIRLREVATKLSSPLYGNMVTLERATALIKAGGD